MQSCLLGPCWLSGEGMGRAGTPGLVVTVRVHGEGGWGMANMESESGALDPPLWGEGLVEEVVA